MEDKICPYLYEFWGRQSWIIPFFQNHSLAYLSGGPIRMNLPVALPRATASLPLFSWQMCVSGCKGGRGGLQNKLSSTSIYNTRSLRGTFCHMNSWIFFFSPVGIALSKMGIALIDAESRYVAKRTKSFLYFLISYKNCHWLPFLPSNSPGLPLVGLE